MTLLHSQVQYADVIAAQHRSLYEVNTELSQIKKSHFVEWFSGDDLDSIWTLTLDSGASGAMSDSVDGGYTINAGSTFSNDATVHMNGISHYSNTGSVIIGVVKQGQTTLLTNHLFGFTDSISFNAFASVRGTPGSNFCINTKDGTTGTSTFAIIFHATNFYTFKL